MHKLNSFFCEAFEHFAVRLLQPKASPRSNWWMKSQMLKADFRQIIDQNKVHSTETTKLWFFVLFWHSSAFGKYVHVRKLLSTIFLLFTAKAKIKDFKQTSSQLNKIRMQCIVGGIPPPKVTWYLQNTKLPYKQTFPDYDVNSNDVLIIPQASLVNNSFLCNCTNPLDSVARFARSKFFLKYFYHSKCDGILYKLILKSTELRTLWKYICRDKNSIVVAKSRK